MNYVKRFMVKKMKSDKDVIKTLALDAFKKQEYVNALMMSNIPLDYKEREKAFINLALARKEANDANFKLEQAVKGN